MSKNKKGFTIIEVVLVLAVAGLIFAMVFVALPALQRSQRNARRRQDMARILSAVNDFQANNNGKSPVQLKGDNKLLGDKRGDFVKNYIDSTCDSGHLPGPVNDPDNATMFSTNYVFICSGDQFTDPDGSTYQIAFSSAGLADYIDAWGINEAYREKHRMILAAGARCSGNEERPLINTLNNGGDETDVALIYILEGGAVYCGDNQ